MLLKLCPRPKIPPPNQPPPPFPPSTLCQVSNRNRGAPKPKNLKASIVFRKPIDIFGTTQRIWPFSTVLAPHLASASAYMIGFVMSHLFKIENYKTFFKNTKFNFIILSFYFLHFFGTTQGIWPFSLVLAPHFTSASAHMIGFVTSHLF